MAATEDNVNKLEKILALVWQKHLADFENSQVKSVLRKIKSLEGIAAIAQTVFQQKISIDRTWIVIFGTLIFVAFFTAVHFFIWQKRSVDAKRKDVGQKLQTA